MVKLLLGVLLMVPTIVVTALLSVVVEEVRVGKFCRLLAPVSTSEASLAVTSLASSVPPTVQMSAWALDRNQRGRRQVKGSRCRTRDRGNHNHRLRQGVSLHAIERLESFLRARLLADARSTRVKDASL